jgi:hypothetical protein
MSFIPARTFTIAVLLLAIFHEASGSPENLNPLQEQIDSLLVELGNRSYMLNPNDGSLALVLGNSIQIKGCQDYPYHDNPAPDAGYQQLATDITEGLEQGLQCIAGLGPMGKLHPYHENQAVKLVALLENRTIKTFQCVADKSFAYGISRASPDLVQGNRIDELTRGIPYPGVLLDTYRISGFLTRNLEPSTYREFFKLEERLIEQHLNNKPVQLDALHRYKNRAALLFHEMVHWLGYVHTSEYPDVVELYETCCFAGDDHISDNAKNRAFQEQACKILRDRELWESNRYRKMRLWHYRGYDRLKRNMRAEYDES